MPSKVTFTDGSTIEYTYAADGTKLRTKHVINGTTTTTDYCGNVIYENGVQKLLLTEAGYVTLADSKYHYYLQDHQGNNRVVIDQNGTVEETNHYYPFGGVFASTSSVQPYKYNGKELDTKKGLNWYDYGARHYDAAVGRFATVDPMAEDYSNISTYTYCLNNPINYIDPLGKDTVNVNNIDWADFNPEKDVVALDEVSVVESNPWQIIENNGSFYQFNIISGKYGKIVGERGLINADSYLFDAITLARALFVKRFSYFTSISSDIPKDIIAKGVDYVMNNPNKVYHIFGQTKHNLAPLVIKMGSNSAVIQSIVKSLLSSGKLPSSGVFQTTVNVANYNVIVRGLVQDGVPKIATMFIP